MALNPSTGLVYLGTRAGGLAVHAPDKDWKSDATVWNLGYDARYDGELTKQADAAPPPKGELVAWHPVERRAAWRVTLPVSQS